MNNKIGSMLVIAAVTAILAGCNKAESPSKVEGDVAAAQADAAKDVGEAKADASEAVSSAAADVRDESKDLAKTAAQGAYDVTIAKADGDLKVATEKCEALKGDPQKACKDGAEAAYQIAKADAKATLERALPH